MITVVTGPPCAGKSTYVRDNAAPGDLIIDFDALAGAFGSVTAHDSPLPFRRVAQYSRAGAQFQTVDPGQNECLLRADRDGRPHWTADQIRRWYRRNPTRKSA